MAHKKPKTTQIVINHGDVLSSGTTTASSRIGFRSLMGSKRDLPSDADETTISDRSKKRKKINSNVGLDNHDPTSSPTPKTIPMENTEPSELASNSSAQDLPVEVRHLCSKYNFTTMSIISSAKISDKVSKLLRRVEISSSAGGKSKPGIVVLRAKSDVASKMVSIVEIARQNIEHNRARWWQYSKLDAQIAEMKPKIVKRKSDGKTVLDWQKERAVQGSLGVDGLGVETVRASAEVQHDQVVVDGDEEMEDAFECMMDFKEVDQGLKESWNGNGRKIRAIPVMTIYFARVPVPGLKELYGEQTNI